MKMGIINLSFDEVGRMLGLPRGIDIVAIRTDPWLIPRSICVKIQGDELPLAGYHIGEEPLTLDYNIVAGGLAEIGHREKSIGPSYT